MVYEIYPSLHNNKQPIALAHWLLNARDVI